MKKTFPALLIEVYLRAIRGWARLWHEWHISSCRRLSGLIPSAQANHHNRPQQVACSVQRVLRAAPLYIMLPFKVVATQLIANRGPCLVDYKARQETMLASLLAGCHRGGGWGEWKRAREPTYSWGSLGCYTDPRHHSLLTRTSLPRLRQGTSGLCGLASSACAGGRKERTIWEVCFRSTG